MAVSWLLNEPGFPASELNEALTTHRAIVPAHWPMEVGNALLMAARRKRIDFGRLAQISIELQGLEVSIEPPPQLDRISELIEFAEGQYVHLTMTSNSTLATLDKAMRQAAGQLRLNILPL
jgi:predicted nucleic acid-binding protein